MFWLHLLAIGIGGGLGSVARYLTVLWSQQHFPAGFPYGVLLVNVFGSFSIGFFMILFNEKLLLPPLWRDALLVGILGGFTTFSTFSLDTVRLFLQGESLAAYANIFASLALCLTGTHLGILLAKQLIK
jgi:CrcB protein